MPLNPKVLEHARNALAPELSRIHREHDDRFRELTTNAALRGPTWKSRSSRRAIFDRILNTYHELAKAIGSALARNLRLQGNEHFTAVEVAAAFNELFEPERSAVLEKRRQLLNDNGHEALINDIVVEGNKLTAAFRADAEQLVVDQQPATSEHKGTNPIWLITNEAVQAELIHLEREQITPWAFLNSSRPFRVTDFYGGLLVVGQFAKEQPPRLAQEW